MDELCGLMRQEQLTPEVFGAWVTRQAFWLGVEPRAELAAEPRSVESARQRVRVFDAFLMRPGVDDCRLTRALIGMRNVFALHAALATPATVRLREVQR